MNQRPDQYHTKQGNAILSYLASQTHTHVTAAQVVRHFEGEDFPVGRTTIYRQLEKLVREGKLRKYTFDGITGACFEYVPKSPVQEYHLKCDNCGGITHLHCNILEKLSEHLLESHEFQINDIKTVFYGKCSTCRQSSKSNHE